MLSTLKRPQTYIQYIDTFDTDTICAVLIDSLARYHGFRDGNKRTALMFTIYTYRFNGVHFTASLSMNSAFDDLVMRTVINKPTVEEIESQLKQIRKHFQGNESPLKGLLRSFRILSIVKSISETSISKKRKK